MNPVELARQGELDTLFAQMDSKSDSRADREVYKWLCCAADFGHDADELIGDVLEVSSLRYDDDGFQQAAAHWELAVAYLLETDGLRFNASLAQKHLETALAQYSLQQIAAGTSESYDAKEVLTALTGERKALLEEVFADAPYRRIRHLLSVFESLRKIDTVPKHVLAHMGTTLARDLRDLLGHDIEEGIYLPSPLEEPQGTP